MPARLRMAHTVDAPTRRPTPASSPAMRRYPQLGFSRAIRTISSRIDDRVGGRPGPCRLVAHRRFTRTACQRRTVPGVTNKCRRQAGRSIRTRALITARSAHDGRARTT